jgi:hypothetical protein
MSRIKRYSLAAVAAGVVIAAGAWLTHLSQEAKERERSRIAVMGILWNLHAYSDINNRLPPPTIADADGQPLFSWRFATAALLLGDPVQCGFYDQAPDIRKSWDAAENRRYQRPPHRDYAGSPASYLDGTRDGGRARFVAVIGPGTAFEEGPRLKMDQLPGDALLVVETRGCPVNWMQPGGDLDVRTVPQQIGVDGGIGPVGDGAQAFYVGFADRSIWLLRTDVPFGTLAKFFSVKAAEPRDREADLEPYAVKVWRPTR